MIFILICFFVCLSIHISLELSQKKITEKPLKGKLINDTINLLLFLIILWCQITLTKEYIKIFSIVLLGMLFILCFVFVNQIKMNVLLWYYMIRIKITYSTMIMKNIKKLEKDIAKKSTTTISKKDIYKEYIILTVILFCKRTVLCLSVLCPLLCFCINYRIFNFAKDLIDLQISFPDVFLINTLIILNSTGLIFCSWKFKRDFAAIDSYPDKSDSGLNPYLDNIIKRLKRYEHDI